MRQLTEQQQQALNIDKHLSVTANAGSGKTMVFAKRYVEIALQKDVSLRNIAAITFTEKAASELYKKIAEELDSLIEISTSIEQTRKLKKIRRELISANISTIHAFCIDILREHPVEAGLDANFTPVDTNTSDELIELSITELLAEYLEKNNDEEIKYLIRLFASKDIFKKQLTAFVNDRKNLLELKSFYGKSEKEIKDIYNENGKRLIQDIFLKNLDEFYSDVKFLNKEVLTADSKNKTGAYVKDKLKFLQGITDTYILFNELHDLKNNIIKKSDGLMPVKYVKKVCEQLWYNDLAERIEGFCSKIFLIDEDYEDAELELAKFSKLMYKYFLLAVKIYNHKKYEQGFLDFEDILINTKNIIENPTVQAELAEKYQYIMVDEYQDTNELQYNIFLPILDGLKKGNLFVVGDEKQSIYGFRDAELEVFDNTKKNIKDFNIDGNIQLPHSFRMAPENCLFTNYIFKNLFSEPNALYNEVEHSDLICGRPEEVTGKVEIICNEISDDEDNEAELVSRRIINLIKNDKIASWQNVAVLCRKRKSFDSLESAFVKYNIPFTIVGGRGFYQRQSIYDFYNYFSFLLDSNNNLALVGILRSPFFNFSDAQIYQLSLQQGKSYWERLNSFVSDDELIKNAVKQLTENLRLINLLDLSEIIRKILSETPYLTVLSSKEKGVQEISNIEKLIDLTINFSSSGFVNLYDYILFLKDAIKSYADESQAEISEDSDSVKIMTLHQAKGLEYSAVFLYQCSEIPVKNTIKSKTVNVDKQFGLLTKVPLKENYFGDYHQIPLMNALKEIKDKKDLAEAKRLFYVGVTRAKDYLCLSYTQKKKVDPYAFTCFLRDGLNFPELPQQEFTIASEVEFLNKPSERIELTIPVIKEIDEVENERIVYSSAKPKNMIGKITDVPEGDMFSATRYTKFKECPLKYQLTYEFGLMSTIDDYKEWLYDKKHRKTDDTVEEKTFNEPMVRGSIIHEVLSENINAEELKEKIDTAIRKHIPKLYLENTVNLKEELYNELSNFYNSELYKEISSYKKFNNEFEIHSSEANFILYGIIDKIAFCDNKIIIIDYKTDKVSDKAKTDIYLNQLKFYSYISSKLFKDFSEIQLKLVYIKNPEKIITINIDRQELNSIKNDIHKTLSLINNNKFEKNKLHCAHCNFSLNRKDCIKKDLG